MKAKKQTLRQRIANIIAPKVLNAMDIPNDFLKYGNKRLKGDWADVDLSDEQFYTGYSYAAIRNRANTVARTATENVRTDSSQSGKKADHPYLTAINDSQLFSEYQFWHDISVYLDLEGIYYLMVVRGESKELDVVGDVQYLKMLNPYHIEPVYKKGDIQPSGYIEAKDGLVREIPPHMIIRIRELNPFSEKKNYAMTDAAREPQFTLKTSGNYTREAIKGNINAPGIMSTGVQLDEEQFKNFQEKIKNHTKGEPIFGNGSGVLTWQDMQTHLSDAALDVVTNINRDELFAVSGMSKTTMGIEQSGTTRETSRVQRELSMEGQILPRIQLILDSLNMDFKLRYPQEFKENPVSITVDNPLGVDQESLLKETEVATKRFELYKTLLRSNVKDKKAAKYVMGEIEIDEIGKIELPDPVVPQEGGETDSEDKDKKDDKKDDKEDDKSEEALHTHNQLDSSGMVAQQEASLKNAIISVESRIAAEVVNKVGKKLAKNQIEEEADVISKKTVSESVEELIFILIGFYAIVMSIKGGETARSRMGKFGLPANFRLDRDIKNWIDETAARVSKSHVDTVVKDLYTTAQKAALEGQSREQVISLLTTKYSEQITKTRATAIARTEANRAFTRAQYESDRQFIKDNGLELRAYKRLRTRSDSPCPFCLAIEAEGLIPFGKAFRNLGDTITVEVDGKEKVMDIDFEAVEAGNIHTNCSCSYELEILPE